MKFLTDKSAVSFAETVGQPFLLLPRPPKFFVNFIVMIIPWLAGIIGVLSLLSTLALLPALFGLNNYITQFSGEAAVSGWNFVNLVPSFIFTVLVGILYVLGFNPLRKRQLNGWMYLFWGNVIGVVSTLWFAVADMKIEVAAIVGMLVGLYVMFQIKREYK